MADPDITVRVALDSDPDDPSPVWTDLTSLGRIHYGEGGQAVRVVVGRQDEQAEIKPTEQGWAVRNHDNAFTPRNPASTYYGKWEHGRRCNVRETVDGDTFDLGTGFLSMPNMPIVDPRSSQAVAVTAVDWMGRLEDAPDFEGTLAEGIRAQDEGLVEWFPLSDPTLPMMSQLTTAQAALVVLQLGPEPNPDLDPEDLVEPARVEGPPGDDVSYPLWVQSLPTSGDTAKMQDARLVAPVDVTVSPGEVLAVSIWVYLQNHDLDPGISPPNSSALSLHSNDFDSLILLRGDPSDLTWEAAVFEPDGAIAQANAGRLLETEAWRLVTVRVAPTTGVVDLWVGRDLAVSSTLAGAPVPAMHFESLEINSFAWVGSLAHAQIRVAAAADAFTRDQHIAQQQHGYRGLQRQTVGERIVTLAGYAGVPATEVDVSTAASTPMQVARLAGVNPATALRAAAETGQDTIVTSGAGPITVVPRSQRYNQPVDMEIPFGWIGYRGMQYRPDKPITDVTVRRVGGGTVRLVDRAKRSRYGVAGLSYDLDTAIDADAANLASWAAAAHGAMRTRCPSIVINMLDRSFAERKQLLGLKVGNRIKITDLPDGSPEDVPHLIIQGIEHTIGPGRIRKIKFNTGPLLGPDVGDPPPCPMVGDLVATTAIVAY